MPTPNSQHPYYQYPSQIQGLPSTDSEGSILAALARAGVIKLPQMVYQAMFDSIDMTLDMQERQAKVRKLLIDYIADEYPTKEIATFAELLTHEARQISPYLPFGFYVRLIDKGADLGNAQYSIQESIRQLTR